MCVDLWLLLTYEWWWPLLHVLMSFSRVDLCVRLLLSPTLDGWSCYYYSFHASLDSSDYYLVQRWVVMTMLVGNILTFSIDLRAGDHRGVVISVLDPTNYSHWSWDYLYTQMLDQSIYTYHWCGPLCYSRPYDVLWCWWILLRFNSWKVMLL